MKTRHKVIYIAGFVLMVLLVAGNLLLFSRISLLRDDASVMGLHNTLLGGIQRAVVKIEFGDKDADLCMEETDRSLSLLMDYAESFGDDDINNALDEIKKNWGDLKGLLLLYRKSSAPDLRGQILNDSDRLWGKTIRAIALMRHDIERRVKLFYFFIPNLISLLILLVFGFILGRLYLRDRMLTLATHDPSGALTKPAFDYILQQHLMLAARYERPSAFLMFTIEDHDRLMEHGREKYEKVMAILVELIGRTLRRTDIIVRLGSDRFGILLPETDLPRAARLASKIRDEVLAFHFGPEPVSLAIGATQFAPGESGEIFVGRAESALLKALKSSDKKIEAL